MISLKIVSIIILLTVAWFNAFSAGGNMAYYQIIGNKHSNLTVAIFNIIASIACFAIIFLVL